MGVTEIRGSLLRVLQVYIYIHIYMSPIPFGLMRLGILSSIINTQANFYYTMLIFVYSSR